MTRLPNKATGLFYGWGMDAAAAGKLPGFALGLIAGFALSAFSAGTHELMGAGVQLLIVLQKLTYAWTFA